MNLKSVQLKIEERFRKSNINKGYKFRRCIGNAFISKRGYKPYFKSKLVENIDSGNIIKANTNEDKTLGTMDIVNIYK